MTAQIYATIILYDPSAHNFHERALAIFPECLMIHVHRAQGFIASCAQPLKEYRTYTKRALSTTLT